MENIFKQIHSNGMYVSQKSQELSKNMKIFIQHCKGVPDWNYTMSYNYLVNFYGYMVHKKDLIKGITRSVHIFICLLINENKMIYININIMILYVGSYM